MEARVEIAPPSGGPFMRITPQGIERQREPLSEHLRDMLAHARRVAVIARAEMRATYFGRSLGWLWLLLEPMLMSLMYWFLVAVLFDLRAEDTRRFITILMLVTMWLWFSRTVQLGPSLFTSYAAMLRDTDFSVYMALAIVVTKELVNFGFNLLVTFCFLMLYGVHLGLALVVFPLVCGVQLMVMLALVMLFATLGTFIKDLGAFLAQFIAVAWYMSPGLYPTEVAARKMGHWFWIMELNPLFWLLPCYEKIVIQDTVPDLRPLLWLGLICVPFLALGIWLIRRARYYYYYFL